MDAAARLAEWIERSKLTQRAAARILGLHYTFLNQILSRRRLPALATAVTIERETGIAAGAWVPTAVGRTTDPIGASGRKRKVA